MPMLRLPAVMVATALVMAACALPETGSGPGQRSGKPTTKPRESTAQESDRLRKQREQAERDGLLVFAAGTLKAVNARRGAELAFQFEQIRAANGKKARPGTIGVPLDCHSGDCQARRFSLKGRALAARTRLSVVNLTPGLWRLSAVRISGQAAVRFKNALPFEIRNGHATYLGSFVLTGASKGRTLRGPIARFSAVQSDMSDALDIYEQTRGRKLINTLRKKTTTTILR